MKKITLLPVCILLILCSAFTSQLILTSLKITVRNELGNLESGVKVSLYSNKDDYDKSVHAVAALTSDAKGNVFFEKLSAISYYISAEKGDRNNFGAGEKTDTLTLNRVNKVTVIISE